MRASRSLPWEQCPWGFVALKAFVLWAVARVLSYGVSKSQALCRAPCWGWVLRRWWPHLGLPVGSQEA